MLDAKQGALEMARRGLPVFPLRPGSKLPFTQDDPARTPSLEGGINRATTNPKKIAAWFARHPGINYGISTVGLIVLDIDPRKNERGWTDELDAVGDKPRTLSNVSGGGGLHYIYRGPDVGQRDISPAVGVRSRGGYIVGPGSVVEGNRYRIHIDAPIAPCPQHIVALCKRVGEKAANNSTPASELDTPGVLAWADDFVKGLPGADKGDRNNELYRLVGKLKDKGVSCDYALALLRDEWCPRCDPPYEDDAEIEASVVSSYNNGQRQPGIDAAELEFDDVSADPDLLTWATRRANAPDTPPAATGEAPDAFVAIDLLEDPAAIAPRPWLFQGDILRRSLTGLVAPGGIGKSAFMVNLAIAAARGDGGFLRFRFAEAEPANVLLIANEDEYDELRMRIHASCVANGVNARSLHGRIFTYRPADARRFLAVIRDPKSGRLGRHKEVNRLIDFVRANNIGLVGYDPLVEMTEGEENSNTDMAVVMGELRRVSRVTNTAGLVIHHTGKAPREDADFYVGNADAGRGGSSFRGNVRRMFTLFPATKSDAEKYGLAPNERRKRIRLDDGKASYSETGDAPRWYELLSVKLPNRETAVALRQVNMHDQEVARKKMFYAHLAQHVMAYDDGRGMPAKTAAKLCCEDPLLGASLSVTTLARRIPEMFADPFVHEADKRRLVWDAGDAVLRIEAHP